MMEMIITMVACRLQLEVTKEIRKRAGDVDEGFDEEMDVDDNSYNDHHDI